MTHAHELSKQDLINDLVISHGTTSTDWDRFYRRWTKAALRSQIVKRLELTLTLTVREYDSE